MIKMEFMRCLSRKIVFLMCSYFLLIVVLIFASIELFHHDYKEELANKAVVIAVSIAETINLDSKDVDKLKNLTFDQLINDPININFEKKSRELMKYSDIKYIYIQAPLKNEKYKIETGEEDKYGAKEGVPLNVIYLLDSVNSDEKRAINNEGKIIDKDRYTIERPTFWEVYKNKKPSYIINKDEWGTYITGYAPFYDNQGNYVGLIGVDLSLQDFVLGDIKRTSIIILFLIILIVTGIFAIVMIIKVKSAEELANINAILSERDSLTGLYNRRHFKKVIEFEWNQSIKKKSPISVMMIDVDYFKEYNDNYGHLLGDDVICKVAFAIKKNLRDNRDFPIRYGGDEFIVVLSDTTSKEAYVIANKILKTVHDMKIEHKYSKIDNYLTMSIGISEAIPDKEMNPKQLLDLADKELYSAKRSGRNRINCSK